MASYVISFGARRRMTKPIINAAPTAPDMTQPLSPQFFASLKTAYDRKPYSIVAPSVVTSTIHPIAVRPIKGIRNETNITIITDL